MSNQNNQGPETWNKLTEEEERNVLAGMGGDNVPPESLNPLPPTVPQGPQDPNYVSPFVAPIAPTVQGNTQDGNPGGKIPV